MVTTRRNQHVDFSRGRDDVHHEECEGPYLPNVKAPVSLDETLRGIAQTMANMKNTLDELAQRVIPTQQSSKENSPLTLPPSLFGVQTKSSTSVSQGSRREDSHYNPLNDLLMKFRDLEPSTFTGESPQEEDPTFFLQEMEHLLHVIDCPLERYVELIDFQLYGRAKGWYDAYKAQRETEKQPLIWSEFFAAFMETFMPHELREERARELEQLKQGDMTVMEYRSKFMYLERYAPHLTTDPYKRAYRFAYGLRYNIGISVPVIENTTFEQVVNMAIRAEQIWLRSKSEQKQHKKVRRRDIQGENSSKRSYARPQFQRSTLMVVGRGGHSNQAFGMRFVTSKGPQRGHNAYMAPVHLAVCGNCGRRHRKCCKGNLLVCYSCGQPGHYS